MGATVVSFFAGTLSVLSPCVLPLLPIVVASAVQRHRHGPIALAVGFVIASAVTGVFFASLAFAVGVDRDVGRTIAAAFMAAIGVVLLVPKAQEMFAGMAAPIANAGTALTARLPGGLAGQLVLGVLLGAIWTPCTGPTLAAAVTLAARSESLARAGAVMLMFGVGAVVPVLVIAYGSRRALAANPLMLGRVAAVAKPMMGAVLLLVGVLALTAADKAIETWMVDHMPPWLLDLTTWL